MTQIREVKRKAREGERIKIVNEGAESCGGIYYKIGDCGIVNRICGDGTIKVDFDFDKTVYVSDGDYVVLEEIDESEDLSAKPAQDQIAEQIANLAHRVAVLEREVAALKDPFGAPPNDAWEGAGTTTITTSIVSKPLSRDEVVTQAKADVADLLKKHLGDYNDVTFVVNREKRIIVALYRIFGDVIVRGKAKCTPGDVFNSHIGKAIALRRALGLEVPSEYLNAPEPTEPRIGDIVMCNVEGVHFTVSPEVVGDGSKLSLEYVKKVINQRWGVRIIDDSREDIAQAEAELTEG